MKKLSLMVLACMLFLTSCGSGGEYAAIVGKERITASEFTFYLENVKSQMQGTELSSDEDWQTNEIEGKKAIDIAREKALETAVNNVAYIEVGKALGIKPSAEDRKSIEANKKRFITQLGTNEQYKAYLKEHGIADSFIGMLCESMFYSSKLTAKIKEEEPVTADDIHNYYEENKEDLQLEYRHAKHILILTKNMTTGEEFSDEDKEKAKSKAEDILKRAKSGEDFDSLANEFSEDPGLKSNPDGYVFGDGEMVSEFQDGTDALKPGEIGLVKSSFGYHIILRLPLEEKDISDKLETELLNNKLSDKMKTWEEEKNITIQINNDIISEIS